MQHLAQHKAAAACATSFLVTSLAALDSSPAYALSLNDVQKIVTSSREFVLSSHWTTFGVGCACGAVVGGLALGIGGRYRNYKLRIELEELRMSASMHSGSRKLNDTEDALGSNRVDERRTGSTAAETTPGEVRSGEPHYNFSPSSTVAIPKSQFGPKARASYIDLCVPRFDESLYPDTSNPVVHDADVFETAMRAMEESLRDSEAIYAQSQGLGYAYASTQTPSTRQASSTNEFDATAYIERIVQDEMERSRSPKEHVLSRAHLTVFDGAGTGDLVVTRKTQRYVPRHMRATSKGA